MPQNPKREPVNVAAIIPARAGKQSIHYKNLRRLGGKTLLAWAIEVAMVADKVDVVIVSTEDAKTAAEAEKLGALVAPRPVEYSQPESGDAGFYSHAVVWLEAEHGWKPELLVNLRPTSPLRFSADVDAMIDYMLKTPDADGLKSVIPSPLHPYKMWVMGDSPRPPGTAGGLAAIFDNDYRRQRGPDQPRQKIQEMFPVYFQDGQIDITRRKFILRPECQEFDNVWGPNLHGYILDPRTSTDLDTEEDFRRAEVLYEEMSRERNSIPPHPVASATDLSLDKERCQVWQQYSPSPNPGEGRGEVISIPFVISPAPLVPVSSPPLLYRAYWLAT